MKTPRLLQRSWRNFCLDNNKLRKPTKIKMSCFLAGVAFYLKRSSRVWGNNGQIISLTEMENCALGE